jgi:AcrR family transcriptional regulator
MTSLETSLPSESATPAGDIPAPLDRAVRPSARHLLLSAAIRLFCRDGIAVTGIDAIVAEAGVARMSLYKNFGSKENLVVAAMEQEGASWRVWFFERLEALPGSPREKLLGVFNVMEEWFARDDYFGCALMNAVLEVRNQSPILLAVTLAHKRPVLAALEELAKDAGAKDPQALADAIDMLMNAAIVKAVFTKRPGAAIDAQKMAQAVLTEYLPDKTNRRSKTKNSG